MAISAHFHLHSLLMLLCERTPTPCVTSFSFTLATMPSEFGPPRPPALEPSSPQGDRDAEAEAAAIAAAREYALAAGLARDHLALDPFGIVCDSLERTSTLIDSRAWLAQDFGQPSPTEPGDAARTWRDVLAQLRDVLRAKLERAPKPTVPKGVLLLLQEARELGEYCSSEKVVEDARAEFKEVSAGVMRAGAQED